MPPPQPPKIAPTTSPTPVPAGSRLPYGSTLLFVLDDRVSSARTAAGTIVHIHLKEPLTVNGTTLAPAGAPATLVVVSTRTSQSGDVDGAVQVHFDPLRLSDGQKLPLRAGHEYLTIERNGGQESTRETTDTLGDIFIPYYVLYHAFRKGHQMVLPTGSVLRAETDAAVDASNPRALVIATPPPFTSRYDTPHSDLTPLPFFTPMPRPSPRPKASASPKPSAAPSSNGATPNAVLGPNASPNPNGAPSSMPSSLERKQ